MRKHLVHVSLFVISFSAAAQDSTKATMLREVVISASRTEQALIEIPRSVTVIHQDVLKRSVYQSLGDLLIAQSGLFVAGAGQTPGTNQNIFMRGASSNQVAVLVDGVRITDPSTPNAAMDISEISLANIERIEVIRGSHSTMFGGAAIGGIINLITRKDATAGFHGGASLQGGVFGKGTWSSSEQVNFNYGTSGGMYLNGSLFRQDVKGLDASQKTDANPSFTSDRDDFKKTDASLQAGYKHNRWDVNLSFKDTHQYTEIDNGAFSDDDNNYLNFDRRLLQYYAGYKLNPYLRLSVLGSFSDSERFYENDSSKVSDHAYDKAYSTGTYFGKLQTHELQINYEEGRWRGVFGAGSYREKMFFDNYFFFNDPMYPFELVTNYDTLDTRTSTKYVFVQSGYMAGNFQVSAGTRMTSHTTAGNFLTFEVNPSFTFRDLLVYGSLSTGFNVPSLYQLYDPSRTFSAYATRGNENLKPERSISLEGGVKKEFLSGSYLTFSVYQTNVTDAIEYVYLWDGAQQVEELNYSHDRGDTYINVGEQLARGLEVEGYARITPEFSLQGNVSFLKTEMRVDPENADTAHTGGNHVQLYNLGAFLSSDFNQHNLIRRPDFTAFTKLRYQLSGDFTIGVAYRYTGKRFDAGYDGSLGPYGALRRIGVEAYHLVDADVNWQATKVVGVGLKVENMLNEDYREVAGFNTRGRGAYLKVTAHW